MNDLKFTINWNDMDNPYNDITNYDYSGMSRLLPPRRTYRSSYTLQEIVDKYYEDAKLSSENTLINSKDLYNNLNKFMDNVNYEMYIKNIDKYTLEEKQEINLDLTQYISDRILNLINIENIQSLLNTYILIYSSIPLVLPHTPLNIKIIINTITTLLITDHQSLININPIILPLYNGIENMMINTINAGINTKLITIYTNRAVMIDCLEIRYNEIYLIFKPYLERIFIDPLIHNILHYYFIYLKRDILNIENTWKHINITQPLNFNIHTERILRLYMLKTNSQFLKNIYIKNILIT